MKIKLKSVTIHKYKSINSNQCFETEKDITVLVGMNESGKTNILEALAKSNYFQKDKKFEYHATHDYPRKEKKRMDKSGIIPNVISAIYVISEELIENIKEDMGEFDLINEITVTTKYNGDAVWTSIPDISTEKFLRFKAEEYGMDYAVLSDIKSYDDICGLLEKIEHDGDDYRRIEKLKQYFENEWNYNDPLSEYILRRYIQPNLPKFLYYDEYYALPSRINIEKLKNDQLESEDLKTAKALFDLADIDIDEIISSDDFEDFKAELEATEVKISEELFEYWSANKNLDIEFDIDKKVSDDRYRNKIVEHILDIRVKNKKTRVSLPLKNRSKGFNWFFSFLVWFKKIQEDKKSGFVLLLDEPGLNLHASAQADLLNFFEDLSKNYQIIYSTHSPFMIPSAGLNRVRTVFDGDSGTVISESVQEKDPNTLFPLQAALGYDLAQNLYISKRNLLVEGISDLTYLQVMSSVLEQCGRTGISEKITIVPVGGLEKVSTFVSLLRGNDLNVICLLDSAIDPSSKSKIDNLVREKIIHNKKIIFFDEFVDGYKEADIEDLFYKEDYIKIFKEAFPEHNNLCLSDLNSSIQRTILQINKYLGKNHFNHFLPANKLASLGVDDKYFNIKTLDRFESMFVKINKITETTM
jgi:predicted ATP-dependent endonuclease of OLD family